LLCEINLGFNFIIYFSCNGIVYYVGELDSIWFDKIKYNFTNIKQI